MDVADHSRSPRRHNAFQRLLALNGALFYKGNFAELLLAANIVEREEPIQQRSWEPLSPYAGCATRFL